MYMGWHQLELYPLLRVPYPWFFMCFVGWGMELSHFDDETVTTIRWIEESEFAYFNLISFLHAAEYGITHHDSADPAVTSSQEEVFGILLPLPAHFREVYLINRLVMEVYRSHFRIHRAIHEIVTSNRINWAFLARDREIGRSGPYLCYSWNVVVEPVPAREVCINRVDATGFSRFNQLTTVRLPNTTVVWTSMDDMEATDSVRWSVSSDMIDRALG